MAIPSREEALQALADILVYANDEAWAKGIVDKNSALLRSYIEGHTGEPLAHEWHERFGLTCCKVCGLVRNENSDTKGCRGPVYVSLREASPVQPVLEWVGTDGNNLSYNGRVIAGIDYSKNNGGFYVMTWLDEHFRKSLTCAQYGPIEDARTALETAARQWLSGGGK